MDKQPEKRIDFAQVFPAKGDKRRPPEWWGRGILYVVIAVFIAIFVWDSWEKISFITVDVVVSIFIALAIEPVVIFLVKHGWKRGLASGASLIGLILVCTILMLLFGNLFVQQVISMVNGLPSIYAQLSEFALDHFKAHMPNLEDLGVQIANNIQTSWITDFAGQAYNTTMGFFGMILDLLTVLTVTFYMSAAGPKMRRSICQWLAPMAQKRFLFTWTVVQDQISGFLFSRTILAALNAFFLAIFLTVIHVPYWLPLSLFCGIVSQFIPTIGTYLGGALPILFAWGSNGISGAVAVLVYIIIYQQIENMILSPKISEQTMDLNPAVAFISVLLFGAIFGALGAFLALPITASIQVILKVYTRSYELVDSPLMEDPKPKATSAVVKGADAINETMRKIMPRTVQSKKHNDNIELLKKEAFGDMIDGQYGNENETVAIPKGIISSDLELASNENLNEDGSHNQNNSIQSGNPRKAWE
ncbi:MAG: AI-2E family transporter [Bifidobacteriaceae bacterium]|nr:AI-2E family transporter [Bifidobacteriaceae bacterium]